MKRIALLIALLSAACMSHARPALRAESPDPVVGNLKCSQPRLTILEALYHAPAAAQVCEPSS